MQPNDTTPASTTLESAAGSPTPEAAPASPAAQTETKGDSAPAPSLEDDLARVYRNANRERDETGRFVGKEPKAGEPIAEMTDLESVKAEPAKIETQKLAAEMPRAWKADLKDKWGTLPPELQTHIASRETELHELKSNFGRAQAELAPLREAMAPYQQYFEQIGMPPTQWMQNALAVSQALDSGQAGDVIKTLARQYGVDLGQLWDPTEQPPDPRVTALEQENQWLKNKRQSAEQQQAASQEAANRQQGVELVQTFFNNNPDAKGLEADLAAQIAAVQSANPNLPPDQVLQRAYEAALWVNPQARETRIAKAAKEQADLAEKAKAEAARKAAWAAQKARGVNVAGAVRSSNGTGDIDTDLRAIWRKNASR